MSIVALAVLLRVVAAFAMGDRVEPLPAIHDQVSYHALALRLLDGHGYSFAADWYPFTAAGAPTAHWSFGYPLYLAAVYAVFGVHPLAARLVQAVVGGVLLCLAGAWLGRRLFGGRAGTFTALALAVYPFFVYYGAALMTEAFYLCAVLGALALTVRLADAPSRRGAVALGLAIGVAALLRQAVLLVVPFQLGWVLWRARGRVSAGQLALVVAAAGALILPWTARNARVYGRPLLLNSNAGYALYVANHADHGVDYDWEIVPPIPPAYAGLNEAETNDRLMADGLQAALADPWRTLRLSWSRLDDYFVFWPTARSGLASNIARTLSFGIFLPFMVYGLALARPAWRDGALLVGFAALYSLMHVLTWPGPRYRMPVDAVLLVFAGRALAELWERGVVHGGARHASPLHRWRARRALGRGTAR